MPDSKESFIPGVRMVVDNSVITYLARIERKLDTLIAALAADEEQEPELMDLEGHPAGGERDTTQSLD